VVSSTATTLCAFLPMLFWPGVPGEFMGMLPVTLIFVLSASLVVALVYLPVMGGVTGRFSRMLDRASTAMKARTPWLLRAALVPVVLTMLFLGALLLLEPGFLFPPLGNGLVSHLPGVALFLVASVLASIVLDAASITWKRTRVEGSRRRTAFGYFTKLIAGNPIMPIVAIASVLGFVVSVFMYFGEHSNGVEFFVESEPEQAIAYVRARGNLSLEEKDALVRRVEDIVLAHPGVINAFSFAGDGGLNTDASGASIPGDTIGQVQFETIPWEDRADRPDLDGNVVIAELNAAAQTLPGIQVEIKALEQGPASGKPVHLRLKADDWDQLLAVTETTRQKFEQTPGLTLVEDTRPLPGIDWQIDVDVEKAGRYGANVAVVGAMVQLVTRGILLDTMRVPSSDEEIEIRVRLPEEDRYLSTLDTLRVRTPDGLVPLSNFITRKPVAKLAEINRVDQKRYFDVKADVLVGLSKVVVAGSDGSDTTLGLVEASDNGQIRGPNGTQYSVFDTGSEVSAASIQDALDDGARVVPVNANERIAQLTQWLETDPLPGVQWEWTGDQEEQEESGAFLMNAFAAALGLMFIILLAQFNSFYNALLVLLAVVLSTTGVLIGMLVMDQTFSIIMTGTGIVALAGIVVNNNIVLIDTYQEYSRYMPRIEAIVRTAEDRIRPVLLTTITTMAGLAPMMFGLSLDFFGGGYSIDSPTALWWKQLATAVVFGLGIATVLTLVFTPAMLAARVWFTTYALWFFRLLARLGGGSASRAGRDWTLQRAARKLKSPTILWEDDEGRPDADYEEGTSGAPGLDDLKRILQRSQANDGTPPVRAAE
jgi:multidrug efflux pump